MLRPDFAGPWDISQVAKIRDALWADDSLREAFIAQNPAGLSAQDLALVQSWRQRKEGKFFVLRHLKKYSIFIAESAVYGVLGLASPLAEVVPFVPCYVETVLLPFEGVIIYDSLIAPWNITFGSGYRRSLEETYKDAKERGAIITSLLPPAHPPSREAKQAEVRATNARVLEAFRTHLFRSGRSPKVVERDLANVTAFAESCLLQQPEPRSLREFGSAEVRAYLGQLRRAASGKRQRPPALISLERLLRFLRDTGRMDYDAAQYLLEILRGRE
jgi:hypothetical protein